MRADVKPLCATMPSMPGTVAIGGAELFCVPAVPFTYICRTPSFDLLNCPHHIPQGTAPSPVHEEFRAGTPWHRQLANALPKAPVVIERGPAEEPDVRISQRFEPRL